MKEEQSKQDVRALFHFSPGISGSSFWRFRLRRMEWKRYGCELARRCITYIKIKSTQPEVDSGSAGRMWMKRCNARLVLLSMLTGRKSGRVSDRAGADTVLAWLEGRYWKTDI